MLEPFWAQEVANFNHYKFAMQSVLICGLQEFHVFELTVNSQGLCYEVIR